MPANCRQPCDNRSPRSAPKTWSSTTPNDHHLGRLAHRPLWRPALFPIPPPPAAGLACGVVRGVVGALLFFLPPHPSRGKPPPAVSLRCRSASERAVSPSRLRSSHRRGTPSDTHA